MRSPLLPVPDMKPDIDRRKALRGEEGKKEEKKEAGEATDEGEVEGDLGKARNVVVIEDLISTGKSSLSAVEALRAEGLEVKGMVAIFTYGFDLAAQNFAASGCPLETLSDYPVLITEAAQREYLTEEQADALLKWREDAVAWSEKFAAPVEPDGAKP